jgi:hypothetical protein
MMTTRSEDAREADGTLVALDNSKELEASADLVMPTLGELLAISIPERQYLLRPWLREHERALGCAGGRWQW